MNLQNESKSKAAYVAPRMQVFTLSSISLLAENSLLHEGVLLGEFEERDEW